MSGSDTELRSGRRLGVLAPALLVAVVVFALDQASKWYVLESLELRDRLEIDVFGPLRFMLAYNTGVNFGLFATGSPIQIYILSAFAAVVSVVLLVWSARSEDRWLGIGCGFAAGGALANALDRLVVGAVVDFINLDCCGLNNPYAFNLADCAIFLGAALIAMTAWRGDEPADDDTTASA